MLVLAGVTACSLPAAADPSFDVGQLGRMQGILDACGKVSPRGAAQYLLQMKALIGDATKQTVDEAARTDEYRQAYQAVAAELGGMEPEELSQACSFYFTTTN